jgi:hypothetical protein
MSVLVAPLEVLDFDGRVILRDATGRSVELLVSQQTGLKEQPVPTRQERREIADELAKAFNHTAQFGWNS